MIGLSEVTAGNPFERFPQLRAVWPDPKLQALAEEATIEEVDRLSQHVKTGPIFLVVHVDEATKAQRVVGITGFFIYDETGLNLGLRWHGIVPDERGKGFSRIALEQVRDIARQAVPGAERLIELIPCTPDRADIEPYFRAMGFKPHGPEETHEWAKHAWQPFALDLAPELASAPDSTPLKDAESVAAKKPRF